MTPLVVVYEIKTEDLLAYARSNPEMMFDLNATDT